jgi:hypothetical protein
VVWVDANGTVVGPSMATIGWVQVAGSPQGPLVTKTIGAYIDQNGYVWSGPTLQYLSPGSQAGAWYQPQGIDGSDTLVGSQEVIGEPLYDFVGGVCRVVGVRVPTQPRLTFSYFDGSAWRFGAVRDAGVTSDVTGQVYKNAGCTTAAGGVGMVTLANPNVAWDLTPPTTNFIKPFHQEYR